jgi:hypothetical protein
VSWADELGWIFLRPCAEDGAHEAETDERKKFIDGVKLFGTHFVHVSGIGHGANETDPYEDAECRAAGRGVNVAPGAELGEEERYDEVQDKSNDERSDGRSAGLLWGDVLEVRPGSIEEYAVPQGAEQPVCDGGYKGRYIIGLHFSSLFKMMW